MPQMDRAPARDLTNVRYAPHRPSIKASSRPWCPRCETRLWLMCLEPDKPGYDTRTFKCPACEYSERLLVKYN